MASSSHDRALTCPCGRLGDLVLTDTDSWKRSWAHAVISMTESRLFLSAAQPKDHRRPVLNDFVEKIFVMCHILFNFVAQYKLNQILVYCLGVPCIQPAEYSGGHRQHGYHCQAVGRGEWGGSGRTDCEISSLCCCFLCSFDFGVVTHIRSSAFISPLWKELLWKWILLIAIDGQHF